MTYADDGRSQPLAGELASALRRRTQQTLDAVQSLRLAVREHVHNERARGATLAEIDNDLKGMIDVAMDSDAGDHSEERVAELRRLVLKLSEAFYGGRGPSRT